jgi:hypothetical protein
MGLSEAFYERVMANVNLKVMMRIGDNRTASDMTEWFGKIASTKKSVGTGITTGLSSTLLKGSLDLSARRSGGESQSVSYQEAEEDLVSAEELKHEMSAEKGLAWFDLGNGKIVKGRSFWFNANLPDTWEGREFIVHPEKLEVDEIGLADWVDEQILSQEQEETSQKFAPKPRSAQDPAPIPEKRSPSTPPANAASGGGAEASPPGSFKLGPLLRAGGRPRGSVTSLLKSPTPPAPPAPESAPAAPQAPPQPPPNQKGKGEAPKPSGPKTGPLKLRK